MKGEWKYKILNVKDDGFEELALDVFRFQYANNSIYRAYVNALKVKPESVDRLSGIPFLPISFFKSHEIKTGSFAAETVFESSGTTAQLRSRHFLKDSGWYEQVFIRAFERVYGQPHDWCIIGLLPSYLERKNSSLVYMVNKLIEVSGNLHSGFYLDEFNKLAEVLFETENNKQPVILFGVTFALLDFAERKKIQLKNTIIIETGGMKGRKEEMLRSEVHEILKNSFGVNAIHSEYGMTELLSQAYSIGGGIFKCPPWMKIIIRDENDPLASMAYLPDMPYLSGAVNIIDLANIYSCSFIATDDAGKLYSDGSFEILGRLDGSDLRGCSLLSV